MCLVFKNNEPLKIERSSIVVLIEVRQGGSKNHSKRVLGARRDADSTVLGQDLSVIVILYTSQFCHRQSVMTSQTYRF